MNNLNSVLIEGAMTYAPQTIPSEKGITACTFAIESNRYHKEGGELKKETWTFDIECESKLAENVLEIGQEGSKVRVVGRLKGNGRFGVVIVAEHVEFQKNKR